MGGCSGEAGVVIVPGCYGVVHCVVVIYDSCCRGERVDLVFCFRPLSSLFGCVLEFGCIKNDTYLNT